MSSSHACCRCECAYVCTQCVCAYVCTQCECVYVCACVCACVAFTSTPQADCARHAHTHCATHCASPYQPCKHAICMAPAVFLLIPISLPPHLLSHSQVLPDLQSPGAATALYKADPSTPSQHAPRSPSPDSRRSSPTRQSPAPTPPPMRTLPARPHSSSHLVPTTQPTFTFPTPSRPASAATAATGSGGQQGGLAYAPPNLLRVARLNQQLSCTPPQGYVQFMGAQAVLHLLDLLVLD